MRFYELWIGLRYTRAKRRNHFISFITGTAMAKTVVTARSWPRAAAWLH